MENATTNTVESGTGPRNLDEIRRRLAAEYPRLSPQVRAAADFVIANPREAALLSVRGLASAAGVNPSSVMSLARAAGFATFEPFRETFRETLQSLQIDYGDRVASLQKNLQERGETVSFLEIAQSSISNIEELFQPGFHELVRRCAERMLAARSIYVGGFRSSFAFAYYFAYVARMALPQVSLVRRDDAVSIDDLAVAGTDDLVILFSFSPYSVETVRMSTLAAQNQAQLIAVTDTLGSPIAAGAEIVVPIPMHGPQYVPSLVACAAFCEALVNECVMIGGDEILSNVKAFQERTAKFGAYAGSASAAK